METTSKTFWQTACELKIGPVPAPVYLVLAVIVAAATIFGQLPADMVGGIAIMMVMGILLGDIGLKVPILKDIGGPAILSIFHSVSDGLLRPLESVTPSRRSRPSPREQIFSTSIFRASL